MEKNMVYLTLPTDIKESTYFAKIKEQVIKEESINSYNTLEPLLNELFSFIYQVGYSEYMYINDEDSEIDFKTVIIKIDAIYYMLSDTSFMGGFTSFHQLEDNDEKTVTDKNIIEKIQTTEEIEQILILM